jgi:hypothetical protein
MGKMAKISLSITEKTEYLMTLFNKRLVKAIAYNGATKEMADAFYDIIIPF